MEKSALKDSLPIIMKQDNAQDRDGIFFSIVERAERFLYRSRSIAKEMNFHDEGRRTERVRHVLRVFADRWSRFILLASKLLSTAGNDLLVMTKLCLFLRFGQTFAVSFLRRSNNLDGSQFVPS